MQETLIPGTDTRKKRHGDDTLCRFVSIALETWIFVGVVCVVLVSLECCVSGVFKDFQPI